MVGKQGEVIGRVGEKAKKEIINVRKEGGWMRVAEPRGGWSERDQVCLQDKETLHQPPTSTYFLPISVSPSIIYQ